jgi:hypothetical protein
MYWRSKGCVANYIGDCCDWEEAVDPSRDEASA